MPTLPVFSVHGPIAAELWTELQAIFSVVLTGLLELASGPQAGQLSTALVPRSDGLRGCYQLRAD